MTARALSVEDLLMHRSWLHRLAVHIVRDDELAHDLVQETWLAALDAAPPSEEKVRPWLAGVLRNLARMSVRTAVRRRGRERTGRSCATKYRTARVTGSGRRCLP